MGKLAVGSHARTRDRTTAGGGAAPPPATNAPIAEGGTVTISGGTVSHTFTASGSFRVYHGGVLSAVNVTGGGSSGPASGNINPGWYPVVVGGGGSVVIEYVTTDLLAGQYAAGGTIAVNGNNIDHTFSAGGTFAPAKKGRFPVNYTITGTGTFNGSGVSGSAVLTADATITVTSGTVVVTYAPGVYEPGNPLWWNTVGTLEGWWDPTQGVTDAGAGQCSQWNDQSANAGHYLQGTAAQRPITGTQATPDGSNALDFDGSNDTMDAAGYVIDVSTRKLMFFGVVKWDDTGVGRGVVNPYQNPADNSLNTFMFEVNNPNQQFVFGNGAAAFGAGNFNERTFTNGTKTSWHRYMFSIDITDTWHAYLDGAEVSTSGGAGAGTCPAANFLSTDSSALRPSCGRRTDPFYFNGQLSHHGYLSGTPLSAGDRTLLDNWLKAKTGAGS